MLASMLAGALSPAMAEESATESEYSIFYSPPERMDALFAAFLDVMPLQTREDALAAYQALWDKSAAENGGKVGVYYWSAPGDSEYTVTEEHILPLESEFGDMPEYWQLRYLLSPAEPEERILLLQKAVDVAPDDAASLYLYWLETESTGGGIYRSVHMKFGTRNEESLTPEEVSLCRNWPQLPAEGLERAARLDGQNAMMYYWTAQKFSILGEHEHVLELLKLGNVCPHNVEVCLFPTSYVFSHVAELSDIVGAERVGCSATLETLWSARPLPNYIELKDMVKEFCVAANLGCDMQALNTVHRFACRFGETQDAPMIQRLVGNVLVGVLAEHVVPLWGPMNPEDQHGFNILYHKMGMVIGMISGSRVSSQHYAEKRSDVWLATLGYLEEPPEPEELVRCFTAWPVYEEFEIKVLGVSVAGIFEDMEAFDYTNPAAYRGY